MSNAGNSHDHAGAVSSNVVTIAGDEANRTVNGQDQASRPYGRPQYDLVVPSIENAMMFHFCAAVDLGRNNIVEARKNALGYAEQAWRAANRSPSPHDQVRQLRFRQAMDDLKQVTVELRAHDHFEVVPTKDQQDVCGDWHSRTMLWFAYGFIGIGVFVLNFTLSSYLLGSGMLDFAEHPFKAFAFCSLPITAALTLKSLTAWLSARTRRRYALFLGVTGGILATVAWATAFAWLFSPQSAGTLALPADDGGIDLDRIIRTALVFFHIVGESFCAAALGLWAEKLARHNMRVEAHVTTEFQTISKRRAEIVQELEELQANQRDELDYQRRWEAGLRAFRQSLGARFDAELRRREAAMTAATAKALSAPSS